MVTVDTFGPVTAYIMSPPAFLIVLSFAGFTYIKKDKYEFDELGSVYKKDMVSNESIFCCWIKRFRIIHEGSEVFRTIGSLVLSAAWCVHPRDSRRK